MKEIKFRFWDGERKEMVYENNLLHGSLNPFRFCRKDNRMVLDVAMQFIGLKDAKKIDIYEGDIVRCGKSNEAMIALVCFKQQAFLLQYFPIEKKKSDQIYDHIEDYEHFVILGNEYENQELLKQKTETV